MADDNKTNGTKQRLPSRLREALQLAPSDLAFGLRRIKPGVDRRRRSVLALWRTLTEDIGRDAVALEVLLSQQMKLDATRRDDMTCCGIIHNIGAPNSLYLGKYGEDRLPEMEFHRRMRAMEENRPC